MKIILSFFLLFICKFPFSAEWITEGTAKVNIKKIELPEGSTYQSFEITDAGKANTGKYSTVICVGHRVAKNNKYAHGLEIPELATSWSYVIGFMNGTTLLHLLGVGIGYFSRKVKNGTVVLRYTGAIVSGIGFHIIFIIFEVQDNFLLLQ